MKKVYVKLSENHARVLSKIIREAVKEIYSGDDWKDRSTLDERTDRIRVETNIMEAIERFEKRICPKVLFDELQGEK